MRLAQTLATTNMLEASRYALAACSRVGRCYRVCAKRKLAECFLARVLPTAKLGSPRLRGRSFPNGMLHSYYKSPNRDFTLLLGDCTELLRQFDFKFDMIVADPPYFLSNGGTQMRDLWSLPAIAKWEKSCGKHPTQKRSASRLRGSLRTSFAYGKTRRIGTDCYAGIAANLLNRRFLGIDSEIDFLEMSKKRREEIEDARIRDDYKNRICRCRDKPLKVGLSST